MEPINLPPVGKTRGRLEAVGFMVLPALLSARFVAVLELCARGLPAKRVVCGIPSVAWDEQAIPTNHLLYRLLLREDVCEYVREAASATGLAEAAQCWTSAYGLGEYINEHKDVTGHVQLLLCLRAPPAGHGGAVRFGAGGSLGEALLAPGDGLLFFASRVIHATTPLRSSAAVAAPRRLVAVARYFQRPPSEYGDRY